VSQTSHIDTPKILIADDNQDNLAVLSDILSLEGWQIAVALDGNSAIEQIEYFLPDLILLDVMMPQMNGYETCQKIKANPNHSDIPIIFITALSDVEQKIRGFASGAVDYITKPFHATEIVARVQVQLKLRQLTQALAQQNISLTNALEREKQLNELKSRFVTTVSHEFRTPLTSILSSAELLEHYSNKWSEDKKLSHLQRIQTSAKHMTDLLNDVLLLGKAEAGKLKLNPIELDLCSFCQEIVEEIQLTTDTHQIMFEKEISWESDRTTTKECPTVYLDKTMLRQILYNLLSNAIKYSPNCDRIDFHLSEEAKRVMFRVRDFGIGIPTGEQEQLYDSFYRADNVGSIPGTGLGLSIVKRAVDLLGGEIAIESQIDRGTTFSVTLPYLN
jgi:two-component system, sensor histidine kinase and response regulator